MQRKMQFAANEVAAILQNISRQKTGGEKVIGKDLSNAFQLANLTIFPGMTQHPTGNSYRAMPLGYMPMLCVFYVVGTGENTAEIKWRFRMFSNGNKNYQYQTSGQFYGSSINFNTTVAHSIHPQLHIKKGEVKIIVEYLLFNDSGMSFSSTGKLTESITKRELFGFLLYNPTARGDIRGFFNAVTIFTPIGTGFSEEAPK